MMHIELDANLVSRIRMLRDISTDRGDAATLDACNQALRGDIHEVFGLVDKLNALETALAAQGLS